jgi:hypothetical protein
MMAEKRTAGATRAKRGEQATPDRKRRPYEGPVEWLFPRLEETYMRLGPKEDVEPALQRPRRSAARSAAARAVAAAAETIRHDERLLDGKLEGVSRNYWEEVLGEYHRRRLATEAPRLAAARALLPGMPAIPGQNNWSPLGPGVVARGQTGNRAAVAGRTSGIAIAPNGMRIYAATANGGVWRSDDGGLSWRSTMDGFDTDPTNFATTSLACGAIAIDPADPNRVYVGTGEGDTDALFAQRVVNALPAYRGIGPIRSDDGGINWANEPSTPSLAGFAFYQIAVDPADGEHCVAATTNGLYERIPSAAGFIWQRRRAGVHTSVAVARAAGTTTWFAAAQGDRVFSSTTGATWTTAGTGFPTGVGRIALGAQPDNPNVLYASIATPAGALHSVRRLTGGAGGWQNIQGVPDVLPGGQGAYDLCISVDPNNVNRIYLGGDFFNTNPFPGSIWRCDVTTSPTLSMTGTSIGQNAHADVHALVHVPGNSARLFTGTDGGLFEHPNATGGGGFISRNTGLGSLCTNFIGHHPTEPAVLYAGLQDNGTAKYTGEQVWRHVLFADGGYCVVNWNDPFRVLLFANGDVYRATDGGLDYGSWASVTPPGATWQVMAEPLVGTPRNPSAPTEAEIVALGVGRTIFISADFGTSWPDQPSLPTASGLAFSMVFASATRLYVGTTTGRVFRLDDAGAAGWTVTRLDNAGGGALALAGLVSDIAVDWSDPTLSSIFISFAGVGDFRHVWRFDGTAWTARSGTAGSGTELLDVEHNSIQYDRMTNRVYVGADIGVWETTDGGANWTPLQRGLPDAPVFDLQIHPTARLLRASLHGRGLFEWKLDAPRLDDVELYVRDTSLDTGRGENTDGRSDPTVAPTTPVVHYLSPNIKVDVPTPVGYQTPTTNIDFTTFNEVIVDGSNGVGTTSPPPTVHNRVYVEVHNRGRVDATNVQVMTAITNAATGLNLPAGYTASVVAGTPLLDPKWTTLQVAVIPEVRAGYPGVAFFDLPSTVLPLPASLPGSSHYCMVTFLHAAQDPYTSTERNVDLLALADRKVGQRNLHIVEFIGTPPPPGTGIGVWTILLVQGANLEARRLVDLVVDAQQFPGTLGFVLPPPFFPTNPGEQAKEFSLQSNDLSKRWVKNHTAAAERLFHEAKYPEEQFALLLGAMKAVADQRPLALRGRQTAAIRGLPLTPRKEHAIFIRVDLPRGTKIGSSFSFDIAVQDSKTAEPLGGSRYLTVVNRPAG